MWFFLMQITDVIECVHSDVPKKHHLNCGFQILTHDAVYNLLTEVSTEYRSMDNVQINYIIMCYAFVLVVYLHVYIAH